MYGDKVDLDGLVDYRAEYTSVLKNVMPTGDDGIVSNCPFHDDSKRSFSVDLKTGKWHCFTEDIGGNFVSFWSRMYGVDTKEAYRQILEKYGKASSQEPRPQASGSKALVSYSLKEYALEKKLPEAYLDKAFGCSTQRDRDGITYLKIPYFPEDKEEKTDFRKRYGKKELRWNYRAKTRLYGEWRLPDIRKAGKVVLVEGESDTQTMWYLGFPSLGVPGASNFKQHEAEQLADLDVWIHVEPDRGGETFLAKVTQMLAAAGHAGKVKKFSCSNYGSKDPSDLLIAKGEDAGEAGGGEVLCDPDPDQQAPDRIRHGGGKDRAVVLPRRRMEDGQLSEVDHLYQPWDNHPGRHRMHRDLRKRQEGGGLSCRPGGGEHGPYRQGGDHHAARLGGARSVPTMDPRRDGLGHGSVGQVVAFRPLPHGRHQGVGGGDE